MPATARRISPTVSAAVEAMAAGSIEARGAIFKEIVKTIQVAELNYADDRLGISSNYLASPATKGWAGNA